MVIRRNVLYGEKLECDTNILVFVQAFLQLINQTKSFIYLKKNTF